MSLIPHATSEGRREARTIGWLLLLGLAVRILAAATMIGGLERPYDDDERQYVKLAAEIEEGQGLLNPLGEPTSDRTPVLPGMVAVVLAVFGDSPLGPRLMATAISTLLVAGCYLLAREMLGRTGALLAGLIAAVLPGWIYLSSAVLTDLPAATFVAFAIWLLIRGQRRAESWAFAAGGALLGLAVLTRPVLIVLAPAVVVWLWLVSEERRKGLVASALVACALGAVILPWSVRNTLAHDRLVLLSTRGGKELWKANNPRATGILYQDHAEAMENPLVSIYEVPDEVDRSEMYREAALDFIRHNPQRFLQLSVVRVTQFWKVYSPRASTFENLAMVGSFGLLMPFFLVQVARRGWRRSPELLLLLSIAAMTAAHAVYPANIRYRVAIEPFVLVLGVGGLLWLVERVAAQTGFERFNFGSR